MIFVPTSGQIFPPNARQTKAAGNLQPSNT
jgi:hypothetical protein